MSPAILLTCALFLGSYLIGSIPWGLVISKVFFGVDLRESGSGNIGTTNAIRVIGKAGGYAVFVLDFLKGLLSGWAAWSMAGAALETGSVFGYSISPLDIVMFFNYAVLGSGALLFVVLGHTFTPWLHFNGGKGIAAGVGGICFLFGPIPVLLEVVVFALLTIVTRHVSVGSIAAAILCPVIAIVLFGFAWDLTLVARVISIACCVVTGVVIVWAHRGNIERLRAGTESTVGSKSKKK